MNENKFVIGYTTGVFDLFHIGHVNILRNAKAMCDKLIVGVSSDELVIQNKSKKTVIPMIERLEIVRSIRYVDAVITQEHTDKYEIWKKLKYDVLFVGDDWYNTDKWDVMEKKLSEVGVRIVYFPYTQGTSSTLINKTLNEIREK